MMDIKYKEVDMAEKEKYKISVIMPVYNVENYIDQAINSALEQNYDDYELIIIDDESTDDTFSKCQKYEAYPNVKLLTQKHGHQAKARNLGIKEAQGEYITFLDGDDFWEPDYLVKVGQILTEFSCDMCIGNQYYCWSQGKRTTHKLYELDKEFEVLSREEAREIIFREEGIPASMCLLIYKKSFLAEKEIRFDEALECGEDFDFFMQGFFNAGIVALIGYCCYNYRQDNIQSTYYNITAKKLTDFMQIHKKWYDYLKEESSTYNQNVLINITKNYRWVVGMLGQVKRNERKKIIDFLESTRYILGEDIEIKQEPYFKEMVKRIIWRWN